MLTPLSYPRSSYPRPLYPPLDHCVNETCSSQGIPLISPRSAGSGSSGAAVTGAAPYWRSIDRDAARHEAERLFEEETERIIQGGGRLNAMSADPSLGFEDMGSMRCDDDFSSCSEEECEANGDPENEDEMPVTCQQSQSRGWGKRPRKTPVPGRTVVDELHIVNLVKAYRLEFAAFCRGKKKAPKQIIPGKVWEKVYHDHYLVTFPSSVFGEDTLKKHLRAQLAELDTGIADDGLRPNLQDEVIATQVRNSDCSATRNILRMRQSFVGGLPLNGVSPPPFPRAPLSGPAASSDPSAGETSTATPTPPPARPATPATSSATTGDNHRPTKSDLLQKQAEAVCTIATDFHTTVEKQSLLVDAKRAKAEEQTLLMGTKRARHQISLLKEGLEIGVITEEEYKAKVVKLLKF